MAPPASVASTAKAPKETPVEAAGLLAAVKRSLAAGDINAALAAADSLKRFDPIRGFEALRAEIFLRMGDAASAVQALREELRFFPDNAAALDSLSRLESSAPPRVTGNEELDALLPVIAPYTMVGPARLLSLYENAATVCRAGPSGNFVECGVAAGGTSGLLSTALLRYDVTRVRRLFACDAFSSAPSPTAQDKRQGVTEHDAECAAPQDSLTLLAQLAHLLGVAHLIRPVKGLFAETLPLVRQAIGPIAFLHMDGVCYESALDVLRRLYDQLEPGAYVQVDDYGHREGCRKAIRKFFAERGMRVKLNAIDATGVWFVK
ncbi:MAG: TylF/MycF family methyltransferase [Deltaproteobacteria bacterium]|nr:TylF/MycF family methyltransferase [Deltaproteobacteria bacterium]